METWQHIVDFVLLFLGLLLLGYICFKELIQSKWLGQLGHQVPDHAAHAASPDQEDSGFLDSETSLSVSLRNENEHGPFQKQID